MSLKKLIYASGGGIWQKIGYVLGKELVDLGYNLEVYATGKPMSMQNPELVSEGKADIGITRHCLVNWAMNGSGPSKKRLTNLRQVISLPRTDWINFLVAKKFNVSTYGELVEKRPPIKIMGFGKDHIVGYIISQILNEYDVDLYDIEKWGGTSYLRGFAGIEGSPRGIEPTISPVEAVKTGKIDAYYGPAPRSSMWGKLATVKPMNFISLDNSLIEKLKRKYGHQERIIHPLTYPNQEQGYITIEFPGYLIFTREDLSNEVIYNITRIFTENISEFATCGVGLEALPDIGLANNWGVPIHPGAEEYYRSKDWIS